jgi:hypothetical protein
VVFGVKSFEHPFDRLEDRCTVVLDLIPHFDERAIRDQADWATTLYPKLKSFLQTAATGNQHLRLILDAHITLAFAAGSVLNIKSGRNVEIEQRTIHRNVWHSSDVPRDPSWPGWQFDLEPLTESYRRHGCRRVPHSRRGPAVKAHVAASLPQVSSLLIARPTCGAGAKSVVCGQHAFDLAEALALQINQQRHSEQAAVAPLHRGAQCLHVSSWDNGSPASERPRCTSTTSKARMAVATWHHWCCQSDALMLGE